MSHSKQAVRTTACIHFVMLIAGCANFNTIDRVNSLPAPLAIVETTQQVHTPAIPAKDGNAAIPASSTSTKTRSITPAKSGYAIHLDAPQRLAFVNSLGQLCAEPSPDAIQAYAASLGASLVIPGKAAEIASALSASSGGIGLRTQAITLMRDHLYRLCEAYANDAMSPEVLQMLQRSQDLTLGVLAIEQLTGAVVAQQPLLTPEASASAARNMLDRSVDALEAAKKNEAAAKAARDKALEARDTAKTSAEESAELDKAAKAKVAPVNATIKKLEPQVKDAGDKLKPLDAAQKAAIKTRDDRKAAIARIQEQLDAATTANNATEVARLTKLKTDEEAQLAKDEESLKKAKEAYDAQYAILLPLQNDLSRAKADTAHKEADSAAKKLAEDRKALATAELTLKAAELDLKDAQAITEVRRQNLATGTAAVESRTKHGGQFSPSADRSHIDKDTIAEIASATRAIVDMVVNKGHVVDTCMNVLSAHARSLANPSPAFLALCTTAVTTYVTEVAKYVQKSGATDARNGDVPDKGSTAASSDASAKPAPKPAPKPGSVGRTLSIPFKF